MVYSNECGKMGYKNEAGRNNGKKRTRREDARIAEDSREEMTVASQGGA
jgi:hypothetical protein